MIDQGCVWAAVAADLRRSRWYRQLGADGEDALQQVMLGVWAAGTDLDSFKALVRYCMVGGRREAARVRRGQRRAVVVPLDALTESQVPVANDFAEGVAGQLAVEEALGSLSPGQRLAMLTAIVGAAPPAGRWDGASRQALSSARKRMRARLDGLAAAWWWRWQRAVENPVVAGGAAAAGLVVAAGLVGLAPSRSTPESPPPAAAVLALAADARRSPAPSTTTPHSALRGIEAHVPASARPRQREFHPPGVLAPVEGQQVRVRHDTRDVTVQARPQARDEGHEMCWSDLPVPLVGRGSGRCLDLPQP
jgi:hypothetical protein